MILKAAVLGIVQGLTEFIPVSSSGHLVLISKLFGWNDLGLAFDVAVHMGTLLALLAYFRREWIAVIKGFLSSLVIRPRDWRGDMRLAWMLVLATIPAALAGALLADLVEKHLRTPFWVATFLVAGSVAMIIAELVGRKARDFNSLLFRDAFSAGFAQVFALAPGVSRSGITMSAGMCSGLDREAAARFAFMMAAPIIGGAGIWEAIKVARDGASAISASAFAVGFVASAAAGFFTVKYLLRYFKSRTLNPFIAYRMVLAAGVFIYLVLT